MSICLIGHNWYSFTKKNFVALVIFILLCLLAIRHQQFRLNMSRDYDMYGVKQDDPTLITFIREIQFKKYPMPFMKNAPVEHLNFSERHDLTTRMSEIIGNLTYRKENGVFVQSMQLTSGLLSPAPWLSETLHWGGLIIEPEPRKYFGLRKANVHRSNVQIVHACVSPNGYPKEVIFSISVYFLLNSNG